MKVRNIDLVGIINTLKHFSNMKLPQRISFAITKNMINLAQDAECYSKSLEKIFNKYEEYFVKDENGNVKVNEQNIPIVDDEHIGSYLKEISELVNIEIDIDLYTIDESVFDYDDTDKYDSLTANDIIKLQTILCKQTENDNQ